MEIKAIQTLLGLMTRWVDSIPFRRTCLQPIGALLGHPDEANTHVKCADPEFPKDFWGTNQLIRQVSQYDLHRPSRFKGDIRRALEARERFPDPSTGSNALWIAGDDTLQMVACVNWGDKTFFKGNAEEAMREFNGPNTAPPIIGDVDMISSADGAVSWGGVDRREGKKRNVSIDGTNNRNVFSWLRKETARIGRSRRILVAFSRAHLPHY